MGSHVVTIRLNDSDPDEARAWELLEKHRDEDGWRSTIVEALLTWDGQTKPVPRDVVSAMNRVDRRMSQLFYLIEDLKNGYVRYEDGELVDGEPTNPKGRRRIDPELRDNINTIISEVKSYGDDDE